MTSNFQELMRHFDMAFSICYVVPMILLLNIIRAYKGMNLRHMWIEVVLDLALGLGLLRFLRFAVFMGVVEDITSAYSHWTYQLIAIIVLSFVLMVIHMIMLLKQDKRTA